MSNAPFPLALFTFSNIFFYREDYYHIFLDISKIYPLLTCFFCAVQLDTEGPSFLITLCILAGKDNGELTRTLVQISSSGRFIHTSYDLQANCYYAVY